MKFIWSGPLRCACTLTCPCPVYDNGNNSVSTATMERVKENPVRILSSLHFSWTRITCVMVRWQDLFHLAIEPFYILYTVLKITITSYRWVVRRERTIFRYIQNLDRFIFMCVDDYYGLCVCYAFKLHTNSLLKTGKAMRLQENTKIMLRSYVKYL